MNPLLFCFYVLTVFGPQPACYPISRPAPIVQQYHAPTMAPVYWQQTMPLAPIVQPAPAIVSPQYPPGYVPNPTQLFSGCRVIQPGLSVCS